MQVQEYKLKPSWALAAILAVGHGGVAIPVLILEIAPAWQVAAIVLLMASLFYELRVAWRSGANAIVAFRISNDDVLSIRLQRGEGRNCEVLGSTYVTAFLTVVNLRVAGERRVRSVIILPDCMAADDYRRLRVWLRWRPQAAAN